MFSESPQIASLELIYESGRSRLFQGKTSNGEDLLIKEDLTGDQARLFNEISITSQSFHTEMDSGVVLHQGKLVMMRKFIPGKSLKDLIPKNGFELQEFLPLAIQIANELQNLHQKNLLHNDVNPRNLICDLINNQVTLIDYEFGTSIENFELHYEQNPQLMGTIEYISPEQTGRMNRKIDYRSDYYGLGATFYEMLCGRPPFVEEDLLRLIHCHLAISPLPPSHFKKSIGKPMDEIVLKLLAKNAEDRYQSIAGLLSDLILIQDLKSSNTPIGRFKTGLQDIPSRLRISQKLYGRSSEINSLEQAYEQAIQGDKVLLTISGQGGVGKSILCQELYRKVSGNTGFFLSGSFDVMDRQTPYLAFEKAFRQFAEWLLISSPDVQKSWSERIIKETNGLGRILFSLAPKLEYILKDQPELLPLKGLENQQRLQFAINAFLQSIATKDSPVVLFLDDYQWANEASVDLLRSLLNNYSLKNILIIVAYRDQSGNLGNTLMNALEVGNQRKHKDTDRTSYHLDLVPLDLQDIVSMLCDTLRATPEEVNELAILVQSKTKGNPFAIIKLLELLYRQKLLSFDYSGNRWTWNLHTIYSLNLSDEVVDILLEKINTLDAEALSLVKIASVFGLGFSINQLEMISGNPPASIHRMLWPLIQEGSLIPLVNDYRYLPEYYSENGRDLQFKFAHARIQQAVYSLLDEREKGKRHFEVGKIFLEKLDPDELEKKSIEIGTHFDLGYHFLKDSDSVEKAANVLLQAGNKSASSAAFDSAFNLTIKGFELLEKRLSQEERFAILLNLLEYSFLTEREEEKQKFEKQAFETAKDQTDRLAIYEVIVRSLTYANQPNQAIRITQKALREVGIKIPDKASVLGIIWEAIKMQFKLPTRKIARLSTLPRAKDPKIKALIKLISAAFPAYYFANIETYPILIFQMLKLTLRHGLAPESPVGIASYGIIRASAMKNPADGYQIVQECRKLVENDDLKKFATTVKFIHVAFVAHFVENTVKSIPIADEGYQNGIAYGNMEYACWNLFFKLVINFHTGKDFKSLLKESEELLRFFRQYNYYSHEELLKVVQNSLEVLVADAKTYPANLERLTKNNEPEFLKANEEKNNVFLYTYHGFKGITTLWFGENQVAFENFELVKKYSKNQPFDVSLQYFELCRGLNAAVLLSKKDNPDTLNKQLKKILKETLAHFKKGMALNPEFGLPVWQFLSASLDSQVSGTINEALFEEAIKGFDQLNQPRYLVLINEIYSTLLSEKGNPKSEIFRNQAIKISGILQSPGKVQQLITNDITQSGKQPTAVMLSNLKTSSSMELASIDTLTLIKTMDALISEIKLESLLEKLLTYAMENSGAQEGHFIINRKGEWIVEVSTLANHSLHTHFPKTKLGEYPEVSQGIVNYAKASEEPVLIADAITTKPYDTDEIVQRKNLRSILCIPFISQSKISGMIYLTHSQTSNAFQKGQISLMRLIAGQIGGIIDNALLYENLENLVKERTRQLEEEKQKSDNLLLNILPKEIAAELIKNGKAAARPYEHVSVMFIDIKGFTTIAEAMTPDTLVKNLHEFFSALDDIMDEFGLEKIKTIGDAYMAAGGIPTPSDDHAIRIVLAGLKILEVVDRYNSEKIDKGESPFVIRIGIHSGPVVAGVVGSKKFVYDIWGDTVNIASRMESNSEAGRINISEDHYRAVADHFECEHRGEIPAKNKGVMHMYFVNHPKS
ncbi:adenylate/guanylate cyclase domain-containing protein [Algoriphagus litoralis]|uniref:adenylate/guanylate cyclase domain-containing protein n=1 Tax=Algoriphagus litoralis TaxID=2202829 RepID=UPI000DB97DCF|nr:adenylate/guanylate cyclase domain-containing protein [Algoriphagus litoralis]